MKESQQSQIVKSSFLTLEKVMWLVSVTQFTSKVKQLPHFNILHPLSPSLHCLDLLWVLARTWFTSFLACGGVKRDSVVHTHTHLVLKFFVKSLLMNVSPLHYRVWIGSCLLLLTLCQHTMFLYTMHHKKGKKYCIVIFIFNKNFWKSYHVFQACLQVLADCRGLHVVFKKWIVVL